MKGYLGDQVYKSIIFKLLEYQVEFKNSKYIETLPLTGNFIDFRGSMLNWCPIGRNASKSQRGVWINLDKKHSIRKNIIENSFNAPQENSKLVNQIKGYLSEGDSVYMQVISNYHKRIQRNIKLEDL